LHQCFDRVIHCRGLFVQTIAQGGFVARLIGIKRSFFASRPVLN
jgi:hypothetical protein